MAWDASRHNPVNPPQEKWHKIWRDIDLNMSLKIFLAYSIISTMGTFYFLKTEVRLNQVLKG